MNLFYLKQIQNNASYTLCAGKEHFLYVSHERGIAPIMLQLAKDPLYFQDCTIVDSVIGKAAAMMFVKSNARFVHGRLMSETAVAFLRRKGIAYTYDTLCPYISNRSHTGMCPMEQTVFDLDDMEIAYVALQKTMRLLTKQKEQ